MVSNQLGSLVCHRILAINENSIMLKRMVLHALLLMVISIIMGSPSWASDSISFGIKVADMQGVSLKDNVAWIKLNSSATQALYDVTQDTNYGKWLSLSVEDIQVMKVRIHAPIDSGIIQIDNPPSQLSNRLREIQPLLSKE